MLSDIGTPPHAVVQVLDSLGKNRGGLTRAVFERFRLLSEGRRAILVTVSNQSDVRAIFNDLMFEGSLPAHTELINYYEDQREVERIGAAPISKPHTAWEKGSPFLGAAEKSQHGSMIRYFQDGAFMGLVYRDDLGQLKHVDSHNPRKPWIRDFRDTYTNGSLHLREFYDDANKPRFRIYVDKAECAFLSAWVSPEGYEYRTVEHMSSHSVQHGDTRAANAAWLRRKLSLIGPSVVYTDEPRTTFALAVQLQDVAHVTSIHTTHHQNNRDISAGIKHWAKFYGQFKENIDRLVFFTETQRQDFIDDTGFPAAKAIVIPHSAPLSLAREVAGNDRDPNLLVTVSRLADDKRIDHAIQAFAKVRQSNSDARYEIWGTGPAGDKLKALVDALGMTDDVILAGHTDSPLAKFASATASVMTSRYEGFGLVITESMACGTPVISYDVIYGPRDVITSENGALVPDGDVDALAAAMAGALTGSHTRRRQAAWETASTYTSSRWANGWKSTLRCS